MTDTERVAEALICRFRSLGGVFSATAEARLSVLRYHPRAEKVISATARAMHHVLRVGLISQPLLGSLSRAVDFLTLHMAHKSAEQVDVLYLDNAARLIRHETSAIGSIDSAPLFPREIVRRALELGAVSIILAHNHPSGNSKPSAQDIFATRQIASAAALFDIDLFDHLIVARGEWTSFRAEGLLN